MSFHCNHAYHEISLEELSTIEKRMYAGQMSESGFLAEGERLDDVYQKDKTFLESVGITYQQIVDRLETLLGKYYRTVNLEYKKTKETNYGKTPTLVEGKYEITHTTWMGAQRCPFQNYDKDNGYHGYSYGDTDITIRNIENGSTISFNTLLTHMIKMHQFFEGSVSHRLDPQLVIETLDIKPNINYKAERKHYYSWQSSSSSSHCGEVPQEMRKQLEHYASASTVLKVCNNLCTILAYAFPTSDFMENCNEWKQKDLDFLRQCIENGDDYETVRTKNLKRRRGETDERNCDMKNMLLESGKLTQANDPSYYSKLQTNEEIEKQVLEEKERSEKFKQTGDINGMALYLYSVDVNRDDLYGPNRIHDTGRVDLTVFGQEVTDFWLGGKGVRRGVRYSYIPIESEVYQCEQQLDDDEPVKVNKV